MKLIFEKFLPILDKITELPQILGKIVNKIFFLKIFCFKIKYELNGIFLI